MTKIIRAMVFVLLLSVCAQAGIIQYDTPAPPPPPPPAPTSVTQVEPESAPSGEGIEEPDATSEAIEAALQMLQSFWTLF